LLLLMVFIVDNAVNPTPSAVQNPDPRPRKPEDVAAAEALVAALAAAPEAAVVAVVAVGAKKDATEDAAEEIPEKTDAIAEPTKDTSRPPHARHCHNP